MYGTPAQSATPACKTRPEAMTLLKGDRPPVRHYAGLVWVIKPAIACPSANESAPRSAPVEWRPIRRTSGWFEPEKLGGDAMTEKTVRRHRARGARYLPDGEGSGWRRPQLTCMTALPLNSRSISRRATVPISLHGVSTAIC